MSNVPSRILLATDLSGRSDRAMDRAALLRRQYGAELLVLHVLEHKPDLWSSTRPSVWAPFERGDPDPARPWMVDRAREHLATELRDAPDQVAMRVEEGDPAEVIRRVAAEYGSDLIVTGVARNESLGRFSLGKTVDRLLRTKGPSLLIVTDRPRAPYANVLVAVDLSATSRRAVETSAAMFPHGRLTIFHAHDVPYATVVTGDPAVYQAGWRQMAHADAREFLKGTTLSEQDRARTEVQVEGGDPERLLRELVPRQGIDLVVLGSHGRGAVAKVFLGSVATRIVAALPCDALVVRAA